MTGRARSRIRRLTILVALIALISTIVAPAAGARPDGEDEKGSHDQESASGDRSDRGRADADDADGAARDHGSRRGDSASDEEGGESSGSGDRSDATTSSAGGGARGLDRFESSGDGSSSSDMTITVGCYSVDVTSSKDISHVEVTFADGSTVKFEGLSGNSYSNNFNQPVASAHAKSGTTIVTDTVSGDCSAVAPPTTCPDGSPMPTDGICDQAQGTVIELCPDGGEMPASGDIADCDSTVLCPDGSEMPAGGNCGDGVPCPDGTTMDDQGNCLEDEVQAGDTERPCPVNPIMGVVLPVLCGDGDSDPTGPGNGKGAPDDNAAGPDDAGDAPDLGANGEGRGPSAAPGDNPAASENDVEDSVLGTRVTAPTAPGTAAPAVAGAAVATAPEVGSAALPATGADLVAFVVLALMLIAIGGLSRRGRRSDP